MKRKQKLGIAFLLMAASFIIKSLLLKNNPEMLQDNTIEEFVSQARTRSYLIIGIQSGIGIYIIYNFFLLLKENKTKD